MSTRVCAIVLYVTGLFFVCSNGQEGWAQRKAPMRATSSSLYWPGAIIEGVGMIGWGVWLEVTEDVVGKV